MIEDKMRNAVDLAINKLLERDIFLLQNDVNERSISHKLGCYLQELFPDWQVDCEYNRNHEDPKRLKLPIESILSDDTDAQTVFPDIIIHKRNTDENLLVIEIKKSSSTKRGDRDLQKLHAFKNQLGYKCALFLKFKTNQLGVEVEEKRWV